MGPEVRTRQAYPSATAAAIHDEVVVDKCRERYRDHHKSTFGEYRTSVYVHDGRGRRSDYPSTHVRNSTSLISHVRMSLKSARNASPLVDNRE